jgi:hypothetical protein
VAKHSVDFWLTTEDLPLPDNRVTTDPAISVLDTNCITLDVLVIWAVAAHGGQLRERV